MRRRSRREYSGRPHPPDDVERGAAAAASPLTRPRRLPAAVAHPALDEAGERLHESSELGWNHELGGRARAECLEGVEVLESHRLLVDPGRRLEDARQRL